jgi:inosine/guanosine/xanthosine phosphorylase family protein
MKLAVIAGSGMGALADLVRAERVVPFSALDGVGECAVAGHAGEIRTGAIGGRDCLLVLGRRHFYEGDPARVERLIDHVIDLGAGALLVTSAAGALHRSLHPGELVVVRDLIDRQNRPPSRARLRLDPALTARLEQAALSAGVAWQRGTLVCGSGPAYETVAEVASLQLAGGDVATMSAAPEVAWASRRGIPVAAAALVTNPCTGVEAAVPSHREVLEVGARAAGELARVISQFISLL